MTLLTIDRAPVGMFAVVFPIWSHSSFRAAFEVNPHFVAVHFAAPFVMVVEIMTATAMIPIAAAAAAALVVIVFVVLIQ